LAYGDAAWVQQAQQPSTQLQGYVNNQPWYAPVPFSPDSLNTPTQEAAGINYQPANGYLYFGAGYDPNGPAQTSQPYSGPSPATLSGQFGSGHGADPQNWSNVSNLNDLSTFNVSNLFGGSSAESWAPLSSQVQTDKYGNQVSLGLGNQDLSGSDAFMYENTWYNPDPSGAPISSGAYQGQTSIDPNGSYNGLVGQTYLSQGGANGIQTANGIQGAGPVVDNVSYSQPSAPQGQQTSNPWTSYMFGNNGDQGNIQGTFGQGYNGPTTFFQSQPSSLNPSSQAGLGTFTPWNPSMQALQQSRSQ
jgi:hypothetical protein